MSAIFAWILGFLKSPKNLAMIAIVLASVYFGWSYTARGKEIAKQDLQIVQLESDIAIAKKELDNKNLVIGVLESRNATVKEVTKSVNKIVEEALNAPKEKDGEVSPVLRDSLDAIDRLRKQKAGH